MHPRKKTIVAQVSYLLPLKETDDRAYHNRYNYIIDIITDKVVNDVVAFTNIPVDDLPQALDNELVLMIHRFLVAFRLLEREEEAQERKEVDRISSLKEGDTTVTYHKMGSEAGGLTAALKANAVTGDSQQTLMHYRRLSWD